MDVAIDGPLVAAKGEKDELFHIIPTSIIVALEEGQIPVSRPDNEHASRSLHGPARTPIANMIVGAIEGYRKPLEIMDTDCYVVAKGKNLESTLGFLHPIITELAESAEFIIES